MYNFEKAVSEHQKKEVEDHLRETGDNQEKYIQEAKAAGYDNLFEYERDLTKETTIKVLGVVAFIVSIIVVSGIAYFRFLSKHY